MQNLNSTEIIKVSGDVPLPRFGHTITLVSKTKAVLFGGATGDTGKYSITGETYVFDCILRKWRKLDPSGSHPSQRAAHASTAVEESQLVIYGGATGGGGLAPDDLYLLDLRSGEDHARWMIVPVVGTTPGARYGHTIAFSKPFLMVFGGNTGNQSVNDVWTLNVEKSPHFWSKLECEGEQPPVRVYHSSALCTSGTANGMIVIFGGRTQDQSALNDSWGLRRHRNKTWDWVRAPYRADATPPMPRYQHSAIFLGSHMLVVGGRTNTVGETVPLEIYDCESSNWQKLTAVQRFRHACWLIDSTLYVHGGFEQDSPNIPTDTVATFNVGRYLAGGPDLNPQQQQQQPFQIESQQQSYQNRQSDLGDHSFIGRPTGNEDNVGRNRRNNPTATSFKSQGVRMSPFVWVVTPNNTRSGQEIIRNVLLENLPEESKKLAPDYNIASNGTSLYYESIYNPFINGLLKPARVVNPSDKFPFKKDQIHKLIDECMRLFDNIDDIPNVLRIKIPIKIFGSLHGQYADLMRLFDSWGAPSDDGDIEGFDYLFLGNYVDRGKNSLEVICLLFALKLKYPEQLHLLRGSHEDIKINKNFGFGEECINRLGEDINDPNSVFQRFNKLFEYLPLAAVIQNKILCVHSGIGSNLRSLQDIDAINRPIEIIQDSERREQQYLLDLLWSDPLQDGSDNNVQAVNNAESGLRGNIKFGPDRLKTFLMDNGLSMMIRSHECVIDGFEKIWNGSLVTVFSATDYCGKFTNAAAVVVIKKNSELTPKVIYQAQKGSFAGFEDDRGIKSAGMKTFGGGMNSTNMSGGMGVTMGGNSNWIDNEESLKKRPATPPRYVTKGNTKK